MVKKRILAFLLILVIALGGFYFKNKNAAPKGPVQYYMSYIPESSSEPAPQNSIKFDGCGPEYLVLIPSLNATSGSLKEALNELFTIDSFDFDGSSLVNPLYNSNAQVEVENTQDKLIVDINGSIISSGTCDDPRIIAQIEETVKHYALDKPYSIRLNGSESEWSCYGDMSGECK